MSRKKVVKSAARKKQPSKQVAKNSVNTVLKLENDFSEAPAKLAEQLTKEIAALKQKESKLTTTITKIQAQINKIEKSIAAGKNAKTAAAKKQLTAAKKVLNDTKKDYALSNAALKETVAALATTEIKLARITALTKALKQFDKDWAKQAKKLKDKAKAKAAAKPKAKVKAKAKKAKKAESATAPTLTVIEQPSSDNIDANTDESEFDDVKQAIS
jgi:hypothetical protein